MVCMVNVLMFPVRTLQVNADRINHSALARIYFEQTTIPNHDRQLSNEKTACVATRFTLRLAMIVSFKHKGLKLLFEQGDRSKIRPDIADKVDRFLSLLNQAEVASDVDLPGFGLHALKGELKGYWSATMSRNHRIIFRFSGQDAMDVQLIDYH